jgi:hypothetical protein
MLSSPKAAPKSCLEHSAHIGNDDPLPHFAQVLINNRKTYRFLNITKKNPENLRKIDVISVPKTIQQTLSIFLLLNSS